MIIPLLFGGGCLLAGAVIRDLFTVDSGAQNPLPPVPLPHVVGPDVRAAIDIVVYGRRDAIVGDFMAGLDNHSRTQGFDFKYAAALRKAAEDYADTYFREVARAYMALPPEVLIAFAYLYNRPNAEQILRALEGSIEHAKNRAMSEVIADFNRPKAA